MTFTVLVVEDDASLREALCDTLAIAGYQTVTGTNGEEALHVLANEPVDLAISDIQMARMDGIKFLNRTKSAYPDLPVMLMTAYGTIQQAVDAMRDGALDYLVKPFEPEVLVSKVSQFLPANLIDDEGMIAVDNKSLEVLELARMVTDSDATILVTGESGTGKEVLVQYIHRNSNRANQPFIAINCAAIPDNMLEAIIFGYQKGAYTGAYKACPGKFEQAQGGTLLLDEISEMSLGLQAKLLRVLQEKVVERLGDQKLIELDVRVMATSNRNMACEVAKGRFREDLYYRLNVFPINMPPLRERKDDIAPIGKYLLARAARAGNCICPDITDDAMQMLQAYHWPGNVRELDNVMQRALILQSSRVITRKDIQFENNEIQRQVAVEVVPACDENQDSLGSDLKAREEEMIIDALEESLGSRKYAAEKLGISPRTLRYKLARMRKQGIAIPAG